MSPPVCSVLYEVLWCCFGHECSTMESYKDIAFVMPLTMTNVGAMHIIGKSIDLNLVIKNQSAMFF